jgi:lysozyme family protein
MTFDAAFERTVGIEGGYVNDPRDPGGETNWGISKRMHPNLDIAHLTRGQAREIYYNEFWLRIRAESLPDGVAFQLFDFAVNSGIETAVRYLQRALHVADDGHWGPVSQAAADRTSESDMIMSLCAERLDFMTRLSNWSVAGKGWARRIAQDLQYGTLDS